MELLKKKLEGKRIKEVRYLTDEEANNIGWEYKPLVIILQDGNYLFPMSDDEGNDAGALATSFKEFPTIGVER